MGWGVAKRDGARVSELARDPSWIVWSMEHAAAPDVLPIGPTESVVEPVPYSFEPDEIVWEWPARERDADGRLVAIDLVAHYWLDCVDCERLPIEITHRFERVD